MSDHAPQVSSVTPTRTQALRPVTAEPALDELADLSDLQERLGNRGTAALIRSALAGDRRPLGPSLRAEMERRFGHDFREVRVHTGDVAAASARAVQALAYTVGHDVVLGAGQDPESPSGRDVLMHELAHVVDYGPAPLPRGGSLVVGPVDDPAEREADRRADAARGAGDSRPDTLGREVPARARPGARAAAAGNATVLRRQPKPGAKTADPEPVIPTPPEERIVTVLTNWLAKAYRIGAGKAGVMVISGTSMRLYRGGQFLQTIRLTPDVFQLWPGVYIPGDPVASGRSQVLRLYKGEHDRWLAPGRSDSEPKMTSMIDTPVADDKAKYTEYLQSVGAHAWTVLQGTGAGSGQGGGGATESGPEGGGEGGPAEESKPLPEWATRINKRLQAKLNSEQLRLAALAKDTIGDTRPETLKRMWAAEGVPKRLALGRSGDSPAEQVTVERAKGKGAASEASAPVRLQEHDEADVVWERILTAGRVLYAGKEKAGAPPAQGPDPIGVIGEGKVDPDAVPPNQPAYPSWIRYYGPAVGVTGVPLHFTMNLDWTIEGEFAVFGPMALRGYAWRFVRIQDTAGTGVEEEARRAHHREAAVAKFETGFGEIGEDFGSSSVIELLAAHDLVAVDTVIRGAGTLIKSFVALASQPSNEQVIRFDRSGVYLVTCVSSHGPVYAKEGEKTPFVRAPSVAAYTLRVQSPQELARSMVAPAQLDAARATLADLAGKAQEAPEDERADLQQAVRDQQAVVDQLAAIERASLPAYLKTQAEASRQQIALVQRLIDLEATGTRPETWTDYEARVLRADLQMKHLTPTGELERLKAAAAQAEVQQQTLKEVTDLKDAGYHPQVAFVPDADGRALPVVMQLAELSDSTDAHQRWVLIDVSVAGHRDRYTGSSTSRGAAGRAEAIAGAFEDFAGKVPYGRGEIGIRLPDVLLEQIEGHPVPTRLRAHPGFNERMWGRLESLATAAAIAGLVVTGPAAVALGIVGGVAGGAVAAHRMYRRYEGGYLELDVTTAMDVFAIVGAVAGVAGPAAAAARTSGRFVQTAGWVERGVEIYGYVQLGTSIIMVPYSYVERLKAIPKDASPGERAALAAEAFVDAANQSLQLAVTAAQMIQHASAPGEVRRPGELPPGREAPPVEQQAPAEQHSPAEQHPPAGEDRTQAQEHARAEGHAPPTDESQERANIEHGMVIMAPEGRSLSRRHATDLFESAARSTPHAEVALLRNVESGDYLVVIGKDESVHLGEGNPDWHEILPERARTGRWVLEEHSHAADPTTGQTPNRARWPSGPDGDFLVVATEALRTGLVARGKIRIHAARGEAVTSYAYHPGTSRPYEVDVALPGNRRYQRRYATIEDYLEDFSARTGEPTLAIPDEFPGARRTEPGPPRPPTAQRPAGEGGTTGSGPVRTSREVPAPARAPGARAGEAPRIRNRRQELAAGEKAVREAGDAGDPRQIAATEQRLADLRHELLEGLEDTGITADQAAKMADGGLNVAQMRALNALVGDRAGTVIRGTSVGNLRDVGEFAARIEPILAEPATQAALEHLRQDKTMEPEKLAEHLRGVPADQLPALMHVLADPFFQVSGLNSDHWALLRKPEVVALIDTHGPEVWAALSGRGKEGRIILEKLAERVAQSPADGEALVDAVLGARTQRAQERVLDIPAPPRKPRQRRALEIKAATDDPLWEPSVEVAEKYVNDPEHQEWVAWATKRKPPWTREDLVQRIAVINQIRAMARRGQYAQLSREQRIKLLDDYIEFARDTGFTENFVGPLNQASGALSETLFLPEGARRGVRLRHPVDPENPAKSRETTLPDYEMPASDRVVPGVRNFVEQKSNELSAETATGTNADDVNLAKAHLKDAVLDVAGIANAPAETLTGFEAPAGGAVHLIEYVRVPNETTREAMYDVLLAPGSPLTAVKFGDLPWMTRQQWAAHRAATSAARGGS